MERVEPEDYIEILCKGELLDLDLNLAALKTFYWKSSEDMTLHYRRKKEYQNTPVRRHSSK